MNIRKLGNPVGRGEFLETYNVASKLLDGPSGPSNVTSTTTSEPPEWLRAPLQNAANAATANYTQQVGSSYQQPNTGGTWTPMGPGGRDGIVGQQLTNGPTGGTPYGATTLMPNAQNLVNSTIQGNYLSPDSNPFLQSTFNRAADLTRGRLDSEFAGAGRNLGASMPARSEELQTLASNLFGGNYQAERDRQTNAVGQAESLDPLNQYINRIAGIIPGAGGVNTSIQPVFKTGLFG